MGFLKRVFGPRWSLMIIHQGKALCALHNPNPKVLLGYVTHLCDGKAPIDPWELHLVFNKTNHTTVIDSKFGPDIKGKAHALFTAVEQIDLNWRWNGIPQEPIFEDLRTGSKLKVRATDPSTFDPFGPEQPNGALPYFSILSKAFGQL